MEKRDCNRRISIIGTGMHLGTERDANAPLESYFGRKPGAIEESTGIKSRFKFHSDENIVSSGVESCRIALSQGNVETYQISGVFSASDACCPTNLPSYSARIGAELGLIDFASFSLQGGCTAPLQALQLAYAQLSIDSSQGREAFYLVVAGDHPSRSVDPNEWATRILFSDATAALLVTNTLPTHGYTIEKIQTFITSTVNLDHVSFRNGRYAPEPELSPQYFRMNGRSVYRYAAGIFKRVKIEVPEFTERAGGFYVIPHQANLRILRKGMEILGLSPGQFYTQGVINFGNTSLASVFIGLHDLFITPSIAHKFKSVLLLGYGAEWQLAYCSLERHGD